MTIELKSINATMTEAEDQLLVNGKDANDIDFIALGISTEDALLIWNAFKYDVLADNDFNTEVYIDTERKKFVIKDCSTHLKWANEYFKTKDELLQFCKQNNLTVTN